MMKAELKTAICSFPMSNGIQIKLMYAAHFPLVACCEVSGYLHPSMYGIGISHFLSLGRD